MFSLPLTHLVAVTLLPLASFASIMWGLLTVVLILTCLLLILIILLQDPKSAGLSSAFGAGGGGGDSLLGAQAQRGVSRLTAILATVFVVLSMVLVLIENNAIQRSPGGIGAAAAPPAAPGGDEPLFDAGGEAVGDGEAVPAPGIDVDGGDSPATPPATPTPTPPATSGDAGDTVTPPSGSGEQ
jgi:preprotein translocase subunit SecG